MTEDLTNPFVVKESCRQYGLRPSREIGQNFLICRDVLDNIAAAADLKKDDVILEVGPGFGALTIELAKRVRKVIAVEQDRILIKALKENLEKEKIKNVDIMEGNILQVKSEKLKAKSYRIVSNLPYQITSHFLRQFLEDEFKPRDMTLMVQKEVAERIVAKPGEMSLLAVSVQFYANPEIVSIVPRKCFWPEPEVDSAILKITLSARRGAERAEIDEKDFFKLVRNGFLHRRQKLINNLSSSFHLDKKNLLVKFGKIGISENARAQELSVDQWTELVKEL